MEDRDDQTFRHYRTWKRALDLLIALILLVPAALLCLLGALAALLEMRCNPFFRQTRIGREQRPFTLHKLRTMPQGTAHVASHEASAEQVTRVGRWLRRTKIDELPQLVCVLRGDMSLVGPRPCLPSQRELIAERSRLGVFSVRPGITGLAQVHGLDMSTPRKLAKVDAIYVRRMSLALDLELLARTLVGHGRGDAVKTGRRPSP